MIVKIPPRRTRMNVFEFSLKNHRKLSGYSGLLLNITFISTIQGVEHSFKFSETFLKFYFFTNELSIFLKNYTIGLSAR